MAEGIQETKDVIAAGEALLVAIEGALEDGKVDLRDIVYAPAALSALKEAFDNFAEVKVELSDLDPEETKELVNGLVTLLLHTYETYKKLAD